MRFTTVISLFASCALLSGSPVVHAAPVPSPIDSIAVKRYCEGSACRMIETTPGSSTDTGTTSQSTDVQNLVKVLINALQNYQTASTPSNTTTTTVDLVTPEAGDESEPEPVIDALLGEV